ncbi:MAG: hypothetical protein DBY42_02670 [Bacillota bacterium]|nr:MAG: hypothetical protein DBY42_02670 [Bacillota bacterium]
MADGVGVGCGALLKMEVARFLRAVLEALMASAVEPLSLISACRLAIRLFSSLRWVAVSRLPRLFIWLWHQLMVLLALFTAAWRLRF